MQNYKVSIAYDGSSFYGFQKQKNRPTVQGKIEEVLDLLIEDYDLNYSGRTMPEFMQKNKYWIFLQIQK